MGTANLEVPESVNPFQGLVGYFCPRIHFDAKDVLSPALWAWKQRLP